MFILLKIIKNVEVVFYTTPTFIIEPKISTSFLKKFHKLLPNGIILYIIVTNPENITIFSVALIMK